MRGGDSLRNLDDCGCCAGVTAQTPAVVKNRPGLSAIAYRVGTQSQFKQSMLAALSNPAFPALQGLRTRENDDFSIALLDGWATVADVLAFYQERIANESYLRTATERRSLLELARLIGYELRPGVAASTYLAFTLDDAPGSPSEVTIETGTKVQSVPGPGEKAQTFETIEMIDARADWNALQPQTKVAQPIVNGLQDLYLQGVNTQLQPGDGILIVGDERAKDDPGSERWDFRELTTVAKNADSDITHVTWEKPLGKFPVLPAAKNIKVFALRQRAALFGHNAPDWDTMPNKVQQAYPKDTNNPDKWPGFTLDATRLDLDAVYPKIVLGSWVVLASPTYVELSQVKGLTSLSRAQFAISAKVSRISPDRLENAGPFSLRTTAVFAHSEELQIAQMPLTSLVGTPSEKLQLEPGLLTPVEGSRITFARVIPGLEKGHTLIFTGKLLRAKVVDSATSGSVLQMETADGRNSKPLTTGERLQILELPSVNPGGNMTWHLQDSEGFAGFVTTTPDRIILTAAAREDVSLSEVVVVEEASGDPTILTLQKPLANKYDRSTVSISANVALATHGETVSEVLGSGDAGHPYQQFTLRQQPLTHVSAPTPSGAVSTLLVRVNDLEWHETSTLYARGPRDRVFVSRRSNDGKTTIAFGDGQTGARLPTGQENVTAVYRKGIGLEGLVKEGQLTQLLKRPLGLKAVTNPIAATGAGDPESLDDARTNAPLTVRTLDRIVSLLDYEDFARAFLGVAKALATWTWDGQTRSVLVTVSGPNGNRIPSDSELSINLLAAMRRSSDPYVPVVIQTYRRATFRVAAKIKIDPDHIQSKVMRDVERALRDTYSFKARDFGQPVEFSELITVIQSVPGVVAVDLVRVYRMDGVAPVNDRLVAELPGVDSSGQILSAELLTLDPAPLEELGMIP